MPGLRLMLGVATGWIGRRLALLLYASGESFNYPHPAGRPVMAVSASNQDDIQPVGIERCSGGVDGHGNQRLDRG